MNNKIGNVWVFIEQEGGKIADVSLELVCKGRELAQQLGVKTEALLLGNGVELIPVRQRIVDMFRTVVNITGDAVTAVLVGSSEKELDRNILNR